MSTRPPDSKQGRGEAVVRKLPGVEREREQHFRRFVRAHCERAWRLAWRLVGGDDTVAEAVVQEAFVKAYRALERGREEASLATWLYWMVVRQADHYARWQTVRRTWRTLWHGKLSHAACPHSEACRLRRRTVKVLAQLSRTQRTAFVLVHLEGFSLREAAVCMGKAEGPVQHHLHRAMQTLRHELAHLTETTGGHQA
jgi:RNA polymerase sigma-70 factor (ECF subfamily)